MPPPFFNGGFYRKRLLFVGEIRIESPAYLAEAEEWGKMKGFTCDYLKDLYL